MFYTGVQNLSNNVKILQIAMKLQKRGSGDQYNEHVSQEKRHAYANIRNETSEAT